VSLTQGLYTRVFDRRRLALALLFPCVGGLYYLWAFGAPAPMLAVNAGALVCGLAWTVWGRLPTGDTARLAIAAAAAALLLLPLLTGPDLDGVQRWLPTGPVQLQSGPLLLPLIVVIAAREARGGAAVLTLATAALAGQPDAAGLAALGLASAVLAWHHRSSAFALVAVGAGAFAALTVHAGALPPQLYVEGVLAHVAEKSLWQAACLAVLLFVVPLWHLVIDPQITRPEGHALAALLTGLGMAALVAPFPFPLIGYGAAPILGFALALGASAHRDQLRVGEHLEVVDRLR
jgi:hypothetical protein